MADITVDTLTTDLEYRADVKTIDKANKAIKELEKSNRAAATATEVLTEEQIGLTDEINETTNKLDDYRASQRKIKAEIKKTGVETKTQKLQLLSLSSQIESTTRKTTALRQQQKQLGIQKARVSLRARKLTKDQARLTKATQKATGALRAEAAAAKTAAAEVAKTAAAASRAAAAKQSATADEPVSGFGRISEMIAGVAGGDLAANAVTSVARGVFELGKEVVTTGANFEILRARLKTVEGSAEGAAKSFKLIQDFTATTPFQLEEVTTAFVRLKSLGLDASRKSLDAFGNLAAAQGKPILEFVEAVADAATGEFERLKEFGIKASSQGDKVAISFKGATTTIGKNAKEIQAFLQNLGETQFAGAMDEQAKTLIGVFSNFQDSLATTADAIAQLGVLDELKLLIKDVSEAIGGAGGLGPLIADVLVTAIRMLRGLLNSLPQDQLIEFFGAIFDVIKLVVGQFTDASSEGSGLFETILSLVTSLIKAAVALVKTGKRIKALNDSLPGLSTLLTLIVAGFDLMLRGLTFLADMLTKVLDLLDPFLSKIEQLADRLPSLSGILTSLGGAFTGLTSDVSGLNSELSLTSKIAGDAIDAVKKLQDAQKVENLSDAELQKRRKAGDRDAEMEIRKRADRREAGERTAEEAKGAKSRASAKGDALDKILADIGEASDDQLTAITLDGSVSEKKRNKAQKELTKREKKAKTKKGKAGAKAAKQTRESLLTATVEKEIDKLAKQAGAREAARALSGGATGAEADRRELTKRKAVGGRLRKQFKDTGQLPPGIANDVAQVANLPNIEAVGGNAAPPVISVINQKFNITGNTFEATVAVQSTNATTGEIIGAQQTAHAVTFQDLGNSVANSMTNERR